MNKEKRTTEEIVKDINRGAFEERVARAEAERKKRWTRYREEDAKGSVTK